MAMTFAGEWRAKSAVNTNDCWSKPRSLFHRFWDKWDKKDVILKNEPRKLLKTNGWQPKTNRNEPENEAGKLLKMRTC